MLWKMNVDGNYILRFGAHGGERLKDVPAAYLVWLYKCDFWWVRENYPEVYEYIRVNLDSISRDIKGE